MKTIINLIIIIFLSNNLIAQQIIINTDLEIESTEISITGENDLIISYCSYDNKNLENLKIYLGEYGIKKWTLLLNINDEITPFMNYWNKPPMLSENNVAIIEFESFNIELNKDSFQLGDIIMGKISGLTKPIYLATGGEYRITVKGEFRHIIGKTITKITSKGRYNIRD